MKTRIWLYSIILSIYLLFREGINALVADSVIQEWLSKANSKIITLLVIVWTVIVLLYYVVKIYYKRRSNWKMVSFLSFFASIYLLERMVYNYWEFDPSGSIKYLDCLLLIFVIGELISALAHTFPRKNLVNNSFFQLDRPVSDTKNDKFERSFFANRISKQINKSFFKESFSIAIIGEWSSGKSTFLNFLESQLNQEDKVIIRFAPWSNISSEVFFLGFIQTVKSELNRYDRNFSSKFDEYYSAISKIEGGMLSRLTTGLDNILSDEKTFQKEQEAINLGLKKLNKQLVIITDDLDRLDSEEIVRVFKLIRNIGNFWNTVYITAFDRAYVTNALTRISSHKPHEYIDKIFDYEFVLPAISKDYLIKDLNQFSKDNLNELFHIDHGTDASRIVESFITNERDLNRFKMHLQLSYTEIAKELVASELFILELIRFRYPQILSYFHNRYKKYLDNPIIEPVDRNYSLIYLDNHLVLKKDIIINERHPNNKFHLSRQQIDEVIFSIKYLFEKRKTDLFDAVQPDNPPFNSIRKVPYFPIYFALVFDHNVIKIDQIKNILDRPWSVVQEYVSNELFYKGLGTKPLQIFEAIKNDFDWFISTKKLYTNTIQLFLSIESFGAPVPKDLLSRFFDESNSRIITYFNSISGLKYFLKELLLDRSFTHHGRSHLVYSYIYDYLNYEDYSFILSSNELKRINYKIFNDYLDSAKETNNNLIDLFYKNFDSIDPNTRQITLNKKACNRLRQFIKKVDSVGYFDLMIRPAMFPNYDNQFVFEPFAKQVFEGWDKFERYLKSQSIYPRQKVLLKYFTKFKDNNYSDFQLTRKEIKNAPKEFINMFHKDT